MVRAKSSGQRVGVSSPPVIPAIRPLRIDLPPRTTCARACYGFHQRVGRDPGASDIANGRSTDDPGAFQHDEAVLEFVASGRRASIEDMGRMDCPSKRATAMLGSRLTMTCSCIEVLRANTAPCGDQVAALAAQRLLAVPWSSVFPVKLTMPASLASALNRDMAGRVKRTVHIKSTPMDFVHDAVAEEEADAPAS